MASGRLFDVPCDEPRPAGTGRAVRGDVEPQLRGASGAGRTHTPVVPRDGGGGGYHGAADRCKGDDVAMAERITWVSLKGYSVEAQLKAEGLSFDAFEIVEKTFKKSGINKLRKKVIGRLGTELRSAYREESENEKDLNAIVNGCYCIGLGGDYKISYSNEFSSRIVYIGSGKVFGRIKTHLSARLFEFAQAMPGVALQFHICDLDGSSFDRKQVEQSLLNKFASMSNGLKPLLNLKEAAAGEVGIRLPTSWDKPLHSDRGVQVAKWLIQPINFEFWKGALDK